MIVLVKYTIIYTYLFLVMIVAFWIGKNVSKERSRNLIHVCAGLGWFYYYYFFPATIHPIIISSSFVALTLLTSTMKVDFIERDDRSFGTVYYTLCMLIMSILGYNNSSLFNVFGMVILCLSLGDAFANVFGSKYGKCKIYSDKSLVGLIACFFSSVMVLLMLKSFLKFDLTLDGIFLLSILCAFTELFSGKYDNIAISVVLYIVGTILMDFGSDIRLYACFGVGILLAGIAIILKLLSLSAVYMLFFMIFTVCYFGGIRSFVILMLIFSIIIIIEKVLGKKTDNLFANVNKEHGARTERQLLANCFVAVVTQIMYGITNNELFMVSYVAVLAETVGDSVASAVGVFSKKDPIDICTFKRIQKGISGGISLLGTLGSMFVCIYSSLVCFIFYDNNVWNSLVVFLASMVGIVLDSVLGSKIQIQYFCNRCKTYTEKEIHCQYPTEQIKGHRMIDNSRVNVICNILTFVCAMILAKGMK